MGYTLTGSNGDFIKRRIIFAPPPKDAVVNITNIKDDIIVDESETKVVEAGFVLVKGHLSKSIEYNTANKGLLNKLMGKEEDKEEEKEEGKEEGKEDKKEDKKPKKEVVCESLAPEPQAMAIDGVVRHTTVWIPFEILVKVDDAKVGDTVSVETPELKPLNQQKPINEIREDGLIIGMLVNDVINVVVNVTEAN